MMGDTINCALRDSPGAGTFDDVLNPEEQMDLAIKLFDVVDNALVRHHAVIDILNND